MMSIFEGAGVALITPFTETGEIDYTRLGELLEFQIAGHTDAIIICGCTGEAAALTPEERQSCIRYTVEQVAHRVPVIAGAGTNITKTAIEWSKDAVDCGADAILSITPYYNKATQKGLIAHYKAIAESVSVPIMLYNVPSRTGVNLLPQTAVTLARECANIVAIKEASGNISQIADLAALADGCLDIYSGNDDMIVPLLSLGGKGVVSVLSNVMPEETHQMVTEYLRGSNQTTAFDAAADPLPVLRGQSDSGKSGFRADGKMWQNTTGSPDRSNAGKPRAFRNVETRIGTSKSIVIVFPKCPF